MAPDLKKSAPSSSSAKSKMVRKGPWTTSEDMILVEYVKKNGEGNWNSVHRNSGLMRCGKSCRLRWANHLRPNLKKGAFSSQEEKSIVQLHAKFGNKWARMAAQLPGRTDNEIKNYWNTRLKRRQRAGLPIYTQEEVHQDQNQMISSPPPSILFPPNPNPNPNSLFYNSFNSNNHHQFKFSVNSSFSSSVPPPPFLSQGGMAINPLIQYNSINYAMNTTTNLGKLGLPSIQSPTASSSDCAEDYGGNGGLEDLFLESQILACEERGKAFLGSVGSSVGHKTVAMESAKGNGNHNYEETKVVGEGTTLMEDDLLSQLLDNFPMSIPIPEWNGQDTESHALTNRRTD